MRNIVIFVKAVILENPNPSKHIRFKACVDGTLLYPKSFLHISTSENKTLTKLNESEWF